MSSFDMSKREGLAPLKQMNRRITSQVLESTSHLKDIELFDRGEYTGINPSHMIPSKVTTPNTTTTSRFTQEDSEEKFMSPEFLKSISENHFPTYDFPTQNFSTEELPNPNELISTFLVKKVSEKMNKTSVEYYELDLLNKRIYIYNNKYHIKKYRDGTKLLLIEPNLNDNTRLTLTFIDAPHVYTLQFETSSERYRFYECAIAIRPSTLLYCPTLTFQGNSCLATIAGEVFVTPPSTKSKSSFFNTLSFISNSDQNIEGIRVKSTQSYMSIDRRNVKGTGLFNLTKNQFENIKVYIGTWNMGNNNPPSNIDNMCHFVPPEMDIYCFAFQESSADNLEKYMLKVIGGGYVLICKLVLWDIRMMIFVINRYISRISCISSGTKATGFLNVCGNKGGVGVSFKFNETHMCFIGCHLAAMEEKLAQRNVNISEIADSLRLGIKDIDVTQFDHVFWCGDLNYRVNMPYEVSLRLIYSNRIKNLIESDQLLRQLRFGSILSGYVEKEITFWPTFKYVIDSPTPIFTEVKSRTPSYCDRILVKSAPFLPIKQLTYNSATAINTSDHKPVYSIFEVGTCLPYCYVFGKKQTKKEIVLSGVYISDREGVLLHKPKLSFYGMWLDATHYKTVQVAKATQPFTNPQFLDESLPVIHLSCNNIENLQIKSIYVIIIDKQHSKDVETVIGYSSLALWDACKRFGSEVPFNTQICFGTSRIGTLNGFMKIRNSN